jgi:O-antigen ligase
MIKTSEIKKKYFNNFNMQIFLLAASLIVLIELLVMQFKMGLFIVISIGLCLTVLTRPEMIYFLLLALFSFDGFTALQDVSYVKLIAVLLTIGLAMRMAITKVAIPKDNSYKYFILFLTGGLISFLVAKDISISLSIYLTYISLIVLYVFTRYFLTNIKIINKALSCLFFSTLIISALVQTLGLSVRYDGSERFSSGIGDPNTFASYILVLLPLAFYRSINSSNIARIMYWVCIFTFIFLLVSTGSRGGMLGFLGATIVLIKHYSLRRVTQFLFFMLIIIFMAYFIIQEEYWIRALTIIHPENEEGASIALRLSHYSAALKMFFDYPITGVGLYNFRLNNIAYGDIREQVVHNTYLEVLSGGGILTFVPFSLILLSCWKKLKLKCYYDKNIRDLIICLRSSFVSILITSFFISGDHQKILWFLFALISSTYYVNETKIKVNIKQ